MKNYGFNDDLHRDNSYSSKLGVRPTLEKRMSSTSSRLSFSSARNEELDSVPLELVGHTSGHYKHKRDTQFDEYLTRRESTGTKADVERAMGTEFGWNSPPVEKPQDDGVVSMGIVKARSRGMSMPRAPSWASDHALVSVPEEEEAAAAAATAHNKAEQDAKDREALLGDSRRDSDEVEDINAVRVPQEVDVTEPRWQREQ